MLTRVFRILLLVVSLAMVIGAVAMTVLGAMMLPAMLFSLGLLAMVYITSAMACSIVRDRGLMPRLMFSGIVVSLGTFAFIVLVTIISRWIEPPQVFILVVIFGSCWSGLTALHGLLALPAPRARWWQRLRRVTTMAISVLAVLVAVGSLLHPDVTPFWTLFGFESEYAVLDWMYRFGMAAVLLVGSLVTVTFLTAAVTPPLIDVGKSLAVTLRCPRCSREQQRMTGSRPCEHCGLRITVHVQ